MFEAKEPLGWARERLGSLMVPANDGPLQPGDMLAMAGPIVHCAPQTSAGEERALLFFTHTLKGFKAYENERQVMPWNYFQEEEHGARDFGRFCESCRQWSSFEPWANYGEGAEIRGEIEKLCRGERHDVKTYF